MKQIKLDEYKNNKKDLKRKRITTIIAIVVITFITIVAVLYISNVEFRNFFDKYILRKEVLQENVQFIEIKPEDANHMYSYDRYITILNENKLKLYSSNAKQEYELDVSISTPIFESSNRFLCIAEKAGSKMYLVNGTSISWQKEIEGQISKVHVNKNGYVAVVISGTSYKTEIIVYNPSGKELFKTYLSTTNAIDVNISNDNKYLAIAEVDTSGTLIQSNIKVVSFEKAQTDTTNSIIYTHQANTDSLILNIRYQDRNRLVCLYNDSIHLIENEQNEELMSLTDKNDIYTEIELENHIIKIVEKATGLFTADSQVQIMNTNNKKENVYTVSGVPKNIYTYDTMIALNLGSEVHFINTNGWLVKKYFSTQEVKDVIMNNNFAGVVYSDKIEIVNF